MLTSESKLVDLLEGYYVSRGYFVAREVGIGYGVADLVAYKLNKPNIRARFHNGQVMALSKSRFFQILDYLPDEGDGPPVHLDAISSHLHRSPKYLKFQILKLMEQAGYVRQVGADEYVRVNGFLPIVNEIIAVEAKVRDWHRGLAQANRYKTFANRAYLAMPQLALKQVPRDLLQRHDLGLLAVTKERVTEPIPAPRSDPTDPVKYNLAAEWLWQYRRPYAERFATQEAFWVPANYLMWRAARGAVEAARRGCRTLIIDPVTNNFSYDKFLNAPTYQALPYCPDDMLTAAAFEDQGFRQSLIRTVLRFQAEQGAGILLAPYLLAENLDSARYPVNLRLATEAKDELNGVEDLRAYQLFAVINISSHFLASPSSVRRVSGDYLTLPVEGYILMIEGFDDRRASQDHLSGLADLVADLSNERDVLVMPIAAFGLVLTALGANGFGAGVGWMETMREQSLMSAQVGYAPEAAYRGRYYYIPELLYYAHPDQVPMLTDPEFCPSLATARCACPECIDSIPEDVRGKRMHFLHCRYGEVAELAETDLGQRRDWVESRMNAALELAPRVFQDTLIDIPTAHLQRWLRTLV